MSQSKVSPGYKRVSSPTNLFTIKEEDSDCVSQLSSQKRELLLKQAKHNIFKIQREEFLDRIVFVRKVVSTKHLRFHQEIEEIKYKMDMRALHKVCNLKIKLNEAINDQKSTNLIINRLKATPQMDSTALFGYSLCAASAAYAGNEIHSAAKLLAKPEISLEPDSKKLFTEALDAFKKAQETMADIDMRKAFDTITDEFISLFGKTFEEEGLDVDENNRFERVKNLMCNLHDNAYTEVSNAASSLVNSASDFIAIIGISIASLYHITQRSDTSWKILSFMSGFVLVYTKTGNSILSRMHKEISNLITLVSDLLSDKVKPQVGSNDLDAIITGVLSLFTGYVSIFAGKNCTSKEIFKNLTQFDRVKGTVTDIVTFVIDIFNDFYNWVQTQVGGKSIMFLNSNQNDLMMFEQEYLEIKNLDSVGEFFVNISNFGILQATIASGNLILKGIKSGNSKSGLILVTTKRINWLEKLEAKFIASNIGSAGVRQEPVGIMLRGGPGVGKSITMQHMNDALLSTILQEREFENYRRNPSDYVFNRAPENVHWDGISQKCKILMIDDAFQATDVAGMPDAEPMNFIRAINSFENVLHCAEMNLKGNVRLNCDFVTATTNMNTYFSCESLRSSEALHRRFPIDVICTLKLEYCTEESKTKDLYNRRLDPTKCNMQVVEDFNNAVNPGFRYISELTPELQEFYPCSPNGKPLGPVWSFKQLLQECISRRELNRSRHLLLVDSFEKTSRKYRSIYHPKEQSGDLDLKSISDLLNEEEECEIDLKLHDYTDFIFSELEIKKLLILYPQWCDEKFHTDDLIDSWFRQAYGFQVNTQSFTRHFKLIMLIRDYGKDLYLSFVNKKILNTNIFAWPSSQIIQDNESYVSLIDLFKKNVPLGDKMGLLYTKLGEITKYFPIVLLGATLLGGSAYVAKKTYDTFFDDVVVSEQSFGLSSKMKTSKSSMKGLVRPQVSSSLDLSGVELVNKIVNKQVYVMVMIQDQKKTRLGYITAIVGKLFAMPKHFLIKFMNMVEKNPDMSETPILVTRRTTGEMFGFYTSIGEIINNYYVTGCSGTDFTLVQLLSSHPHRDITKHFISEDKTKYLTVDIPTVLRLPANSVQAVGGLARTFARPVEVNSSALGEYEILKGFSYLASTRDGDCGALLTFLNAQSISEKILGFHVAGIESKGVGYSQLITQEILREAISNFGKQIMGAEIEIDYVDDEKVREQGRFNYEGSVKKFPSRNMKTELTRSVLHNTYCPSPNGTAQLKPQMVDGVLKDPMQLAQLKYGLPPVKLDRNIIQLCEDSLYTMLKTNIVRNITPRKLTIQEALHGIELEEKYSAIPPDTSAGFPMNVPGNLNLKQKYFYGTLIEKTESLKEITHRVSKVIELAIIGQRTQWLWTDNVKDEKRTLEKVKEFSTRMFSGCPFIYQVVYRMYFGSFTLFITENKIENGFATGVNPFSSEWNSIVTRFKRVTPANEPVMVGAGDYKAFDGSEKQEIHEASLNIINRWYNDSDENQFIRQVLNADLHNSMHIVDGHIYEWNSGLPSGHPGTIVFNGLYNHMAFRYSWLLLGLDISKFNRNVYLIVQGDDNVFGVVTRYRHIFNEMTLVEPMKTIGLTYTTETKDNAVFPFRNIEDVEFLKRKFKFFPELNLYLAPLRLSVVLDIPMWTKMGSDAHKITTSNTNEAIRELSLHPKEVFQEWSSKILKAHESATIPLPLRDSMLQSYETTQAVVRNLVEFY